MSHAEIWDDSALVDSWNEALEEYKHYHSIHARGEKVEDILRAYDSQNNQTDVVNGGVEDQRPPNDEGEIPNTMNTGDDAERATEAERIQARDKLSSPNQTSATVMEAASQEPASPFPPPQFLVGSVRDEGLKKLLMSWYYAGYYTGFYEGQQNSRHVSG